MKVDRRTERDFPALLPERITALARHYDIELGETRRIAGYDCQADGAHAQGQPALRLPALRRHGERHAASAVTVDPTGEPIEQFIVHAARDRRGDARHGEAAPRVAQDWRIEDAEAAPGAPRGLGPLQPSCPGSTR